jgi:catechol 2,3-dioxygenase-like lactoylglutathione lyase family enzyme
MTTGWPANMPVTQIRIARSTDKLDEVVQFYSQGIGLKILGSFHDHDGYSGCILGLPGRELHLEFTHHAEGSPCPAPSRDNLLVLYLPDRAAIASVVNQLREGGHEPVPPENPYWAEKGVTFEDPDGWRVVLMNMPGFEVG